MQNVNYRNPGYGSPESGNLLAYRIQHCPLPNTIEFQPQRPTRYAENAVHIIRSVLFGPNDTFGSL